MFIIKCHSSTNRYKGAPSERDVGPRSSLGRTQVLVCHSRTLIKASPPCPNSAFWKCPVCGRNGHLVGPSLPAPEKVQWTERRSMLPGFKHPCGGLCPSLLCGTAQYNTKGLWQVLRTNLETCLGPQMQILHDRFKFQTIAASCNFIR